MPTANSPTRLLILGSTSKVAGLLQRYWSLNSPENLDIFWISRRDAPGVTHVWSPGMAVSSLPQCDAVLGLWGTVSGSPVELENNISLAVAAQSLALALGADRVLHASSVAVYDPTGGMISETDTCAPRNAYGAAKLAMEHRVRAMTPQPVCLRIANVVGADSLFSALSRPDSPNLTIFPDGRGPVRSYLRPSTLAASIEALCAAPLAELPDVVNIAEANPTDMSDILRAAERSFDVVPADAGALPVMHVDVSRLEGLIGHPLPQVDANTLVAEWRSLREPT